MADNLSPSVGAKIELVLRLSLLPSVFSGSWRLPNISSSSSSSSSSVYRKERYENVTYARKNKVFHVRLTGDNGSNIKGMSRAVQGGIEGGASPCVAARRVKFAAKSFLSPFLLEKSTEKSFLNQMRE